MNKYFMINNGRRHFKSNCCSRILININRKKINLIPNKNISTIQNTKTYQYNI